MDNDDINEWTRDAINRLDNGDSFVELSRFIDFNVQCYHEHDTEIESLDCYYDDEGVRYVRHDNGKFEPEIPVDKNGFWKCTSLTDYDTDNPDGQTPQQKYLEYHKQLCNDCRELSESKQNDYCDLSDLNDNLSIFGNFMLPEKMNIISTEQSILSRICDKFNRVITVINNDECNVTDENELDTIQDIINFLILLSYYRSMKNTD